MNRIWRSIVSHRCQLAAAALAAGWILLLADDLSFVPLTLPLPLHNDLLVGLGSGTIVVAVAMLIRTRLLYSTLKLGRQIQSDTVQQWVNRSGYFDGPTVGVGIAPAVPPMGSPCKERA